MANFLVATIPVIGHVTPETTLDGTSWLRRPFANLWTASAHPWVTLDDDMLAVAQQPTVQDYEEINRKAEK